MYFEDAFIHKIFRLGFLVVLILVFLDLLTFFYYPDGFFGNVFIATKEQTPLTWVSSITLFIVGLSCAAAYYKTRNRIWYFLSLTYLFFSMDDAIYFHERFSGSLQKHIDFLNSFPSYTWVIIYFPILVFGLFGLVYMLWKDLPKKQKKLFILAVALLAFSILLDMIDGFVIKNSTVTFCTTKTCNLYVTHVLRLIEEVCEVISFGMLALLNLREHNLKKLNLTNLFK